MAPINRPNPNRPGSPIFGAEAAKRRTTIGTKAVFADAPANKKRQAAANDSKQVMDREGYEALPEAGLNRGASMNKKRLR